MTIDLRYGDTIEQMKLIKHQSKINKKRKIIKEFAEC